MLHLPFVFNWIVDKEGIPCISNVRFATRVALNRTAARDIPNMKCHIYLSCSIKCQSLNRYLLTPCLCTSTSVDTAANIKCQVCHICSIVMAMNTTYSKYKMSLLSLVYRSGSHNLKYCNYEISPMLLMWHLMRRLKAMIRICYTISDVSR